VYHDLSYEKSMGSEISADIDAADSMKKESKFVKEYNKKLSDLKGELGDVLWYYTQLLRYFGFDLDDVAELNLSKLRVRNKNNEILER